MATKEPTTKKIVTAAEIAAKRRARKTTPKAKVKEPTMRRADKNRRRARTRAKTENKQTLEDLLRHLGIPENEWEYLIVGDGSGTTIGNGSGSAAVVVERETMRRWECGSTLTHATNIMAEIFAYVVPLLVIARNKHKRTAKGVRVHIVTDCLHLVQAWEHRQSRQKNLELWGFLESFKRRGLVIKFHWVPRATWDLNRYCDRAASLRRKSQKKLPGHILKSLNLKSIYDINPITE